MKQASFWKNPEKSHGARKGQRKCARPVATKKPMHVIVKSSRARGKWNLLLHGRRIEKAIQETAKRFGVRIYHFQNVGNHIHLAVRPRSREAFQNFLRVFTQVVMFLVTGARKGKRIGKFWDRLAFSRIVQWGRDWDNLCCYFSKNCLEAKGIPRDVIDFALAQESG